MQVLLCGDDDFIEIGANADVIRREDNRHNAVVAAIAIIPFATRRLDVELHPGGCGFPSVR